MPSRTARREDADAPDQHHCTSDRAARTVEARALVLAWYVDGARLNATIDPYWSLLWA
jgi:hypothetical protein